MLVDEKNVFLIFSFTSLSQNVNLVKMGRTEKGFAAMLFA
jgi:hypothetical protein